MSFRHAEGQPPCCPSYEERTEPVPPKLICDSDRIEDLSVVPVRLSEGPNPLLRLAIRRRDDLRVVRKFTSVEHSFRLDTAKPRTSKQGRREQHSR